MMGNIPHFVVIGAVKSGTTSLHEYLRQHPMLSLPIQKETHYFICMENGEPVDNPFMGRLLEDFVTTKEDYFASFEKKPSATVFGEVCPSYLHYPNVPINIHETVPDTRIIVILRNPVKRFISNMDYYLAKYGSNPSIDLDNIVKSSEYNLDLERILYIGKYSEHLKRYYQYFSKDQIRIYLFEDLRDTPQALMNNLIEFIGVPSFDFNTSKKFNISGVPRYPWVYQRFGRTSFTREIRRRLPKPIYQVMRPIAEKLFFKKGSSLPESNNESLQKYYREDILELQDLIQRDLTSWLE